MNLPTMNLPHGEFTTMNLTKIDTIYLNIFIICPDFL